VGLRYRAARSVRPLPVVRSPDGVADIRHRTPGSFAGTKPVGAPTASGRSYCSPVGCGPAFESEARARRRDPDGHHPPDTVTGPAAR